MSNTPNTEGQRPDTIMAVQLEILMHRLVKDEISKRNPVDPAAVEEIVVKHLRVTDDGRIIARGPQGGDLVGRSVGHTMELPEFLDTLAKDNPALFAPKAPPQPNPFKKGPNFNMTEAFDLLRSDRELALKFAAEAGVDLGVSQ